MHNIHYGRLKEASRINRLHNKKPPIYCTECCHRLPEPIVMRDDEYTVCTNKECELYGKPTNNWSI